MVSLTITSYLIIQGISPLFWGPLSEALGRRPVYIYSFSVYIAANIVLSISPNFVVLLLFRGLQSAGSASTVSIGTYCTLSHLAVSALTVSSRKWRDSRYFRAD